MKRDIILSYLCSVKEKYQEEGLIIKALFGSYSREEANSNSDIDILIEVTPKFAKKYGFRAFSRLKEIKEEMSKGLNGIEIDLTDIFGLGKSGKKFIIDRAIYL